jgi:quercetin dioxygenase-like cupin family protein
MSAVEEHSAIVGRPAIDQLQRVMVQLPQVELPTAHHFADGVYLREMHCDAGTTIVGKVHKRPHFFILAEGEMTVTGDGQHPRLIKAPAIITSGPGIKRVGYAHTKCVCLNVHRTDSVDLDEIEVELIEPDDSALFDARNEIKLEVLP